MSDLTDKIKAEVTDKIFTSNIEKTALGEILTEIAVLAEGETPSTKTTATLILNQTDTSNPVVSVFDNDTGITIDFTRSGAGVYVSNVPVSNNTIGYILSNEVAPVAGDSTQSRVFKLENKDDEETPLAFWTLTYKLHNASATTSIDTFIGLMVKFEVKSA